jgi:hypothetical protein
VRSPHDDSADQRLPGVSRDIFVQDISEGITPDQDLLADAMLTFAPLRVASRRRAQDVVVDVLRSDGSVLWPDYASGPTELMAILAAEQRYLAEEAGHGSAPGATYADKAAERLRLHRPSR